MVIQVCFRHMAGSERLRRFTTEKILGVVQGLGLSNLRVRVTFTPEHGDYYARCQVQGRRLSISCEGADSSPYAAIEKLLDHLESQLLRTKERRRGRVHAVDHAVAAAFWNSEPHSSSRWRPSLEG